MLGAASPTLRRIGVLWVVATIVINTAISATVDTERAYIIVVFLLGFGPYTVPGVFVARHAVRYVEPGDRASYTVLHSGLVVAFLIGFVWLAGLAFDWDILFLTFPAGVCLIGVLHIVGVAMLVRRRSGDRALSVDVIEAAASVLAATAPLVVLWGDDVMAADNLPFTLGAALILLCTMIGTYWVALLWVRIGPGRPDVFQGSAMISVLVGSIAAALHVRQGIVNFTDPPPSAFALTALAASAYLMVPLHVPFLVGDGKQGPPQAQVRGAWLPTVAPLAGTCALLVATAVAVHDHPWTGPFTVAVLAILAILTALRQGAALRETKRLYRQVEATADERQHLLAQLLERSVADRQRVAQELHKQAMAVYVSIATLTSTERTGPVLAMASRHLRADLERNAHALHDVVMSLRQRAEGTQPGLRLLAPVKAYLNTIYDGHAAPELTMTVADDLVLDWVIETVLLQVVQEALHNVRQHAHARTVHLTVEPDGAAVKLVVVDDGIGFDRGTTDDGAGFATMRAACAAVDGSLAVSSIPSQGTTVTAHLGATDLDPTDPPAPPTLRLV